MASLQEIVDDIRGYILAGCRTPSETIISHAEQYATACREANDRLRKCNDAMLRGLRSDAIHFAEADPNLLDLVGLLDFPELPQWKQACVTHEMVSPPELLIEMASTLNEAYAFDQPLKTLMANHRIMALARAPLDKRLTVMRRIAELDTASGFWDEDVRTFEQARVQEMRAQFSQAVKSNDSATIARLHDEAGKPVWRISLPQDLRLALQDACTRQQSGKVVTALRALLPALNDAYGAMSLRDCRARLEEWSNLAASSTQQVPAELQEQVDPIFAWVEQETARGEQAAAFEQACASLAEVMNQNQPPEVLGRAYQSVREFNLDIPQEMEDRYRQLLAAHADRIRRNRRMVYAGGGAAFAAIAAAIAFIVYQHQLDAEIADAKTTLNTAMNDLQQGELKQAQSLKTQLTTQHPRVLGNSAIMNQLREFDSQAAIEQSREQDFQQQMQALNATGVEKSSPGVLDRADALAKTAVEKAQVEQFKSKVESSQLDKQQAANSRFTDDCTAISKDIDRELTHDAMSSDADAYRQKLESIGKQVEELRQRPGVDANLKETRLAGLDTILTTDKNDLDSLYKQTNALAALKKFGATAKDHASALKQFITDCPGDSRVADFQKAYERSPGNQAVEDWSAMVAGWSQLMPGNLGDVQARVKAIQDYLDQNPASPVSADVQAYQTYLQLAIDTVKQDGPWKSPDNDGSFDRILSLKVCTLYCLDSLDGKRYYVKDAHTSVQDKTKPDGSHKDFTFDAVTSVSTDLVLTNVHVKDLVAQVPAQSPEAVFATAATKKIDDLQFNNQWDEFGLDVLDQLAAAKDMNPVMRAILLKRALESDSAVEAWRGESDLPQLLQFLKGAGVDDVPWLNPDTPPSQSLVDQLELKFAKLRPLVSTARAAIVQKRADVLRAVKIPVEGEGLLLRDKDTLQLISSGSHPSGQLLFAVIGNNKLEQVGQATAGGWSFDRMKSANLPDGSLIFIVSAVK